MMLRIWYVKKNFLGLVFAVLTITIVTPAFIYDLLSPSELFAMGGYSVLFTGGGVLAGIVDTYWMWERGT